MKYALQALKSHPYTAALLSFVGVLSFGLVQLHAMLQAVLQ